MGKLGSHRFAGLSNSGMRIYLDHNAGTPLRPAARGALARLLARDGGGNPASVHHAGQRARRALEESRARVGRLIGGSAREIVFTSGGTESNNLAIFGAVRTSEGDRHKIITSAIEHSSIIAPVAELEKRGFEVVRILPDAEGRIAPEALASAIDSNTAIVTLGLANAEVGTVQECAPLRAATARAGALFHVDAAQAAGRIPVSADELGCDLMTISAHKIGGPAGIGALYVRAGAALTPQTLGGPQEGGLRAGTPNLIGAIGFGIAAAETIDKLCEESQQIGALAAALVQHLNASIPGLRFNGARRQRILNTLNLTFPGVLGESMLIALDLQGVEVSMGSACAAGAVEPSHVLLAMGRSVEEARSSLRISLGWNTTADEVARAAEIIPRVWRQVAAAEPVAVAEASR